VTGSAQGESRPAGAGPETVRVVRPGHPLHGLDLPVWGWLRLRGVAMVVLVLPDGSRKRVPAAWAHEGGSEDTGAPAAAVVAAAGDLLRLLRVISGIPATVGNHAEQAARQSPGKEDDRAACTAQSAARPATPAHRASRGRDHDTPDHPGGATRIAGRAGNAGRGIGRRGAAGGERR